jgi:DtxR family transcriptional regulator, Mn-dependent transcriptional regulator
MSEHRLEMVAAGTTVRIASMEGDTGTVRRVQELGITVGAVVRVVRKAPFNGPIEVAVGRTHIGLRPVREVVILVEPCEAV